jgi:hypothetical protein
MRLPRTPSHPNSWSVKTNIPVQIDPATGNSKNFTIAYIVYEKDADCNQYPADGEVTFFDIALEYNNQPVQPLWKTGIVDDVCNNRARVVNASTVQITWNTQMENSSPYHLQRKAAAAAGGPKQDHRLGSRHGKL